ncbi:MAG: helix-turn-helix domain-containing protein [Clostridiales bacterium]|nr:helix-turn-helix domain-containing protein [Clostridiales bacterium]
MQLDPTYYEPSSVHYFVPQPEGREHLLYYPVSIGYFDCKPSYGVQRNVFSSYLLLIMLTGSMYYQTMKSRGVVRAGQVLLLDCNAPHSYSAQGKCSFTFVHFAGAQSKELYEEIERSTGNLIPLLTPNDLHETIGEMLSSMRSERRMNESDTSAMIYGMLMKLLDKSGASGEGGIGNPVVDRAIAYIQTHLTEKLSVEEISAKAGYSASYFSHLFAEETGMSPYRFVVKSRVEHAQQLLKTTRLAVQEIAFQCGFNSAANFCYTFRRMTGISPHEYRKRPM